MTVNKGFIIFAVCAFTHTNFVGVIALGTILGSQMLCQLGGVGTALTGFVFLYMIALSHLSPRKPRAG